MALDSKDSDIEQLRNLLSSTNVSSLESASINSGPDFDADDAYTGKEYPFYTVCVCKTQCTSSPVHIALYLTCMFKLTFGYFLNSKPNYKLSFEPWMLIG